MEEVWKDIKGYEGIYQVSNNGRIKSLERDKNNHSKKQKVEAKIRKNVLSKGYYLCLLSKNGKNKMMRVHRLVAEAFIPNPKKHPIINHIDGNKLNNCVDNLEWCDYSYNEKEAYRLGLRRYNNNLKVYTDNMKKRVNQYEINGKFIKTWDSVSDIHRQYNYTTTNICACCKNKRKTAYGYKWKYAEEAENVKSRSRGKIIRTSCKSY